MLRKLASVTALIVFGAVFNWTYGQSETAQSKMPAASPQAALKHDVVSSWDYRGVSIGMEMAEAREKLGSAKDKTDTADLYLHSDGVTAQVFYGPAKKVRALSVTFTENLDQVPTPKAIFGEEVKADENGGIFKMARYLKKGFWISYNKIAGDNSMIIITTQKM